MRGALSDSVKDGLDHSCFLRGILTAGDDGQIIYAFACDRRVEPIDGYMVFQHLEDALQWFEYRLGARRSDVSSAIKQEWERTTGSDTGASAAAEAAARRAFIQAADAYCLSVQEFALPSRQGQRAMMEPWQAWRVIIDARRRRATTRQRDAAPRCLGNMRSSHRISPPEIKVEWNGETVDVYGQIRDRGFVRLREPGCEPTLHIVGYIAQHNRLTEYTREPYVGSPLAETDLDHRICVNQRGLIIMLVGDPLPPGSLPRDIPLVMKRDEREWDVREGAEWERLELSDLPAKGESPQPSGPE